MASRDSEQIGNLSVNTAFRAFIEAELLPAIDVDAGEFWRGLETLIEDLTPVNRDLLLLRDAMQQQIDDWHGLRADAPLDHAEYVAFLKDIGYLHESGEPFQISTEGVDPEIAEIAGPQLVVPVSNARFALNAANARWGSLYDALYGTDVIPEDGGKAAGAVYNPTRGAAVIVLPSQSPGRSCAVP